VVNGVVTAARASSTFDMVTSCRSLWLFTVWPVVMLTISREKMV
jgi:hypothetical protein